jgi:pimeloyl-ACP methyl ester carboxylesterase
MSLNYQRTAIHACSDVKLPVSRKVSMTPHSFTQTRNHVRSADSARGPAQRILLRDGRLLAYAEYGSARGYPLFYVHDSGSSRLEAAFLDAEARRRGFRLVALDRPGVGESDPLSGFTRATCADDIVQLADHLRCERFGLLATGAGSGIALVTAALAPERVAMVLGLSSQLPADSPHANLPCRLIRQLFGVVLQGGISLRLLLRRTSPEGYIQRLCDSLSYADRRLLENPKIRDHLIDVAQEAVRSGASGVARDAVLAISPLQLEFQKLVMPVHLWQGSSEISTRHNALRGLADALPNAILHRLNNRGRYFYWRHTEEVFAAAQAVVRSKEPNIMTGTIRQSQPAEAAEVMAVALAG